MCLVQRRGEAEKNRIFINFVDRDAQSIHYLYEEVGSRKRTKDQSVKSERDTSNG